MYEPGVYIETRGVRVCLCRYHCSHCNKKVNASRQNELVSLPPTLCFQLMRYQYDYVSHHQPTPLLSALGA